MMADVVLTLDFGPNIPTVVINASMTETTARMLKSHMKEPGLKEVRVRTLLPMLESTEFQVKV
jgi:hypothetical protein